ncbi:MAG: acetyl-CoA carboxylase biotin carboxyl carrier protein [Bryobacteraceae bacterium]|jgi:acetyl-CoA carboxylase biotin carboxyl carrier protein
MSNDEIKELIQLVTQSGIAELEVQRGDARVRIRRTQEQQSYVMAAPMAASAPAAMVETGAPAPSQPPPPPTANEHIVKSPIVGTYYDAPKPGDPVFVKVGDVVETGQVLCIIESMKLMNEIESEIAGTVVAKLMENGRPVEYGEALFAIRPR